MGLTAQGCRYTDIYKEIRGKIKPQLFIANCWGKQNINQKKNIFQKCRIDIYKVFMGKIKPQLSSQTVGVDYERKKFLKKCRIDIYKENRGKIKPQLFSRTVGAELIIIIN